ncbi:MAG: hypothetical protein A3G33_04435 [Omnitrophica bacterium RIFCSPLOWO2_12_FULL_44_17]|uniref:Uncharacterized protein n=1 Tax=Candidatus Danuiimicrobium aquiferis TaxID=1801832 RepID=A0A1G1KQS4_9BACT|nr:MAG: hypothetical protein A3B72_10645 [Omnitrophica bacterium RIFCSPHIGHO2_02_FULL_45_28]OGW92287.1 MAG: hypothetical protein A3E74_09455 [Omnitrophica bacterium RIFCSPHIGHO2_12_FULL_44_12]OGW95182.1 MAG: hypothetical protein A3G33_04435 [Omnitrophica bacterium RIFCSPLOWO2_12_FULL_44_17]OGX01673.1 MAG: hypothetical protein A3J12_04000 [Omnitrophica bacterium RIFCSPLOWO2_02_FULL_44_11]
MLIGKKGSIFGISYFHGDELHVVFIDHAHGQTRVIGKETISVRSSENLSAADHTLVEFRKRILSYRARIQSWVHLVFRNVSIVKVFPVPQVPETELDQAITNRVHAEIPYLSEEVILHQVLQEAQQGKESQVLLFGVSKGVLGEQLKRLEAFGVIPDRVVLSTEALGWLYRTKVFPEENPKDLVLMVYFFNGHVELLFFEDHVLLQSRWLSQEANQGVGMQESIRATIAAFQREWHRKPEQIYVAGLSSSNAEAMSSDPSYSVKVMMEDSNQEGHPPALFNAVIESISSDEIFDYTLSSYKEVRDQKSRVVGRSKIASSVFCLTAALLLLALVQVGIVFGQISWFQFRTGTFSADVKEIKKMHQEAVAIVDFYEKKALPIETVASLREAISTEMLLREVEYDFDKRTISVRGIAPDQALVDQFIAKLEQGGFYEKLKLERIQAEQSDQAKTVFDFSFEGHIKVTSESN